MTQATLIRSGTSVKGNLVIVTGASGGMGRALAVEAAKRGCLGLALCDVNMKELEETARLSREASKAGQDFKVLADRVDVSDRLQVEAWRDLVVAQFADAPGMLIFNNAGINAVGKLVYSPKDDVKALEKAWQRCFDIDFFGVLHCTRAFIPYAISRKEAHICNTASVNAFYTWPEHSAYTAAKHAVKGLTESLMIEMRLKAPHVLVTCLFPGGVKTGIAEGTLLADNSSNSQELLKEVSGLFQKIADLTSEEAAVWILDACKKGESRVLVGYDAILIDKMVRMAPSLVYSFYTEAGRLGLGDSVFDPDSKEALRSKVGVTTPIRLFFSGAWYTLACMSPMVLVQARHLPGWGKAIIASGSAAAVYHVLNQAGKL